MSRSNSILLQVAFKEAATASLGTNASVKDLTREYYTTLVELHAELGIEITDDKPRRQGSFGSGGGASAPKPLPANVTPFTDSASVGWNDFRAAKASESVSPKHPDFKSQDNKQSVWLFSQDGGENPEAITLAQAADAMASLAATM